MLVITDFITGMSLCCMALMYTQQQFIHMYTIDFTKLTVCLSLRQRVFTQQEQVQYAQTLVCLSVCCTHCFLFLSIHHGHQFMDTLHLTRLFHWLVYHLFDSFFTQSLQELLIYRLNDCLFYFHLESFANFVKSSFN